MSNIARRLARIEARHVVEAQAAAIEPLPRIEQERMLAEHICQHGSKGAAAYASALLAARRSAEATEGQKQLRALLDTRWQRLEAEGGKRFSKARASAGKLLDRVEPNPAADPFVDLKAQVDARIAALQAPRGVQDV